MDKITAMSIRYVILLATAALVSGGLLFLPAASKTDGAPTPPPSEIKTFVASRCAGCHQGKTPAAGLDLTSIGFALDHAQTLSWWVRVHDAVRDGRMPPPAAGSVAPAGSQKFLTSLSTHLTAHARQRAAAQGRSVLRRLNRYEYESTVRDLLSAPWLQLKDSLPEDGVVHRFNKSGEGLDVSHVQMARYLEAAEQALRDALAAAKVPSHSERQYAREQKPLIRRMSFGPFNNHPERATIPILGFDAQPEVMALKAPMTVGSADPATREREGFATPASTYIGNEMHFDGFTAPVGGAYRVRFNAFSLWVHTKYVAAPGGKEKSWRPTREKTSPGKTTEPVTLYAINTAREKRLLGSFDVTPAPAMHEMVVNLLAGESIMPDASRLFRSRPGFISSPDATAEGMPGVAYRWMDVDGPLETDASRGVYARLFGDLLATRAPDGRRRVNGTAADAERLLRQFVQRAYRRPVREEEVQRYLGIVKARLGSGFTEAMMAGYVAVMCSPGFLYLEELPGPLSAWALASRLSYFLWNAPPDERLRTLAAKDQLRQPAVLRAEARRMLADGRSRDFVNAFLDYWLDLRKAGDTTPDQTLYPEYYLDDLLNESAMLETQMFFDYLLRKNLPASNMVDSKFTILNSHLARHYGLPPVPGVAMRYAELPAGSARGGLMTQASILKITANGTTTSPVLRGVWIMERILGDPPPPPPPGVPAVEPDTRGATTIRQQLDQHRSVASCAACHQKIDPPGFALENFDVVGAWRDRYRSLEQGEPMNGFGKNGFPFAFRWGPPVDASGKLASGAAFANVMELKRQLLKNERQIARNLVTQLVTYSTGTAPAFGDRAEVERILRAESPGYGVASLVEQIVESKLFLNK